MHPETPFVTDNPPQSSCYQSNLGHYVFHKLKWLNPGNLSHKGSKNGGPSPKTSSAAKWTKGKPPWVPMTLDQLGQATDPPSHATKSL